MGVAAKVSRLKGAPGIPFRNANHADVNTTADKGSQSPALSKTAEGGCAQFAFDVRAGQDGKISEIAISSMMSIISPRVPKTDGKEPMGIYKKVMAQHTSEKPSEPKKSAKPPKFLKISLNGLSCEAKRADKADTKPIKASPATVLDKNNNMGSPPLHLQHAAYGVKPSDYPV